MESILSARNQYPAPELGTDRGSWLVGGAAAARSRGIPMIKRCGIEGDPTYFEFMKQHFRDHGLDPAGDCLLQAAVEVAADRARWPKSDLGSKAPVPPRSAFSKPVSGGLIREIAFD
jgi:hypothetical protein